MNKLFNLIILFLTLAYLTPFVFANIPGVAGNIHYYNIIAGFSVLVVQFLYNLYMKFYNKKPELTIGNNLLDSVLKGVIVIASYYAYEELRSRYDIRISLNEDIVKATSVIGVLLIFILLNSLVMP